MAVAVVRDDHGRWLAGHSGNPAGRPPVLQEVRQLARAHTALAVAVLASIAADAAAHPLARIVAARDLLDRAHGRPRPMAAEVDASDLARLSDSDLVRVERASRAPRRWVWRGPRVEPSLRRSSCPSPRRPGR